MFCKYSYGDSSTNPTSFQLGGDSMFPGEINPGLHNQVARLGQSELFSSDSVHGEIEPTIPNTEPGHQANYSSVVFNYCASVDKAEFLFADSKEFFLPKGTIVSLVQNHDADRPRHSSFNAPGQKPHVSRVCAHSMPVNRPTEGFYRLGTKSGASQFLVQAPLAEGSFIRPHAHENYLSVAVADTATVLVPKSRKHSAGDPIKNEVTAYGGIHAKAITLEGEGGIFPAGSLVYCTPASFVYHKKIYVDIVLSTVPINLSECTCLQFLGVLRVAHMADDSEGELTIALSPTPLMNASQR